MFLTSQGFKFELFGRHQSSTPGDIPQLVGSSIVLPVNLKQPVGVKTVPITGVKNLPIGQLTGEFCENYRSLIVSTNNNPRSSYICEFRAHITRTRSQSNISLLVMEISSFSVCVFVCVFVCVCVCVCGTFDSRSPWDQDPLQTNHRVVEFDIAVDCLLIKPIRNELSDCRVSYSNHWKHKRRALDVGHRGMGSSHCDPAKK